MKESTVVVGEGGMPGRSRNINEGEDRPIIRVAKSTPKGIRRIKGNNADTTGRR